MNPFETWIFLLVPILLLNADPTQCEVHSLIYIYTAFSKPVDLPGIYEFTAMAQLDGQMIQYYDSVNQEMVPKQPWMKERLPSEYWVDGTRYRQYKQQWFKVNMNILMKRMGQNDAETHILQWMYGCEGDMQPDGTLKFKRGWDIYNYDGKVFLYDYFQGLWVDRIEAAKEWEGSHLQAYNQGQQNDCIARLSKFITYGDKQHLTASPPDVFLFAKNARVSANVVLICLATGFYSNYTKLQIRKDGRLLEEEDGVITSGVRPNGDGTFQRRDEVEIIRAEDAHYTCEVDHKASNVHEDWDHKLPVHPNGGGEIISPVVGAVAGIVILAIVVVIIGGSDRSIKESNESIVTNNSGVQLPDDSGKLLKDEEPNDQPLTPVEMDDKDKPLKPFALDVNRGSVNSIDSGVSTNNSSPSTPESEHFMKK